MPDNGQTIKKPAKMKKRLSYNRVLLPVVCVMKRVCD